jgi:hypothetical protein
MDKQKQTNINKLVGRSEDGDYYWLDYVFEDGEELRGAVGSVFRPVSEAQKEETMSLDNAKERFVDIWAEAARDRRTEQGLEEFVQDIIAVDGEEAFFDFSYYHNSCEIAKVYNSELPENTEESEKAEFSECVGGGRCFNHKIKWAKVYDKKALKLALSYEID